MVIKIVCPYTERHKWREISFCRSPDRERQARAAAAARQVSPPRTELGSSSHHRYTACTYKVSDASCACPVALSASYMSGIGLVTTISLDSCVCWMHLTSRIHTYQHHRNNGQTTPWTHQRETFRLNDNQSFDYSNKAAWAPGAGDASEA